MIAAGDAVADAAEPPRPRRLMRIEHIREPAVQREVGVRDDTGDLRTGSCRGLARHAGHPFRLANRSQVLGTVVAVVAAALGVYRLHHTVAGPGVRLQVGKQVASPLVPLFDEMVVGVDDLAVGFEYLRISTDRCAPGVAAHGESSRG